MGNTNSQSKQFEKEFKNEYEKVESIKHETLGDITVYKSKKQSDRIFHKSHIAKSPEEHQYLLDICKKRNDIFHSYIMRLFAYKSSLKGHSCTSINKIEIYSEYHEQTLLKEINQRFKNKNYFTEAELILILYHLVDGIKHLLDKGINAEDIRPATIFLAPDVRLADRTINLGSQGNYMLAAKQQARVLLSPEQIEQLQHKIAYPDYKISQSDIFSLGMTMLIAASLTSFEIFYDYPQYNLQYDSIENYCQKIGQMYTPFFCKFIKLMLDKNPSDRPAISDLYSVLNTYSQQIESGQAFQVSYSELSQSMYNKKTDTVIANKLIGSNKI